MFYFHSIFMIQKKSSTFSTTLYSAFISKKKCKNQFTYNYIGWFSAELWHDALEAGVLADLGGRVDVLHREQGPQAEQQDLRQRSNKLQILKG